MKTYCPKCGKSCNVYSHTYKGQGTQYEFVCDNCGRFTDISGVKVHSGRNATEGHRTGARVEYDEASPLGRDYEMDYEPESENNIPEIIIEQKVMLNDWIRENPPFSASWEWEYKRGECIVECQPEYQLIDNGNLVGICRNGRFGGGVKVVEIYSNDEIGNPKWISL